MMQLAGCVTRGRQEGLLRGVARGVCPGLLAGQPGATLPHDCQGTLSQWPRCPLPLWGWGGDPRRDGTLVPESAPQTQTGRGRSVRDSRADQRAEGGGPAFSGKFEVK